MDNDASEMSSSTSSDTSSLTQILLPMNDIYCKFYAENIQNKLKDALLQKNSITLTPQSQSLIDPPGNVVYDTVYELFYEFLADIITLTDTSLDEIYNFTMNDFPSIELQLCSDFYPYYESYLLPLLSDPDTPAQNFALPETLLSQCRDYLNSFANPT